VRRNAIVRIYAICVERNAAAGIATEVRVMQKVDCDRGDRIAGSLVGSPGVQAGLQAYSEVHGAINYRALRPQGPVVNVSPSSQWGEPWLQRTANLTLPDLGRYLRWVRCSRRRCRSPLPRPAGRQSALPDWAMN